MTSNPLYLILTDILEHFTYKPGYEFTFSTEILFLAHKPRVVLVILALVQDATKPTGQMMKLGFSMSHDIPDELVGQSLWTSNTPGDYVRKTEEFVARCLRLTIQEFEHHEIVEFLKYRGKHVVDPHPEHRPIDMSNTPMGEISEGP